jgi:PAS domain S-box-containing protein
MSAIGQLTSRRRSWPIVAVFTGVIGLQVLVAMFSIDLLSAVRAYVTGESLYSKGQKDAQIYLLDYVDSQREDDYQRFLHALAEPLGDRVAREELQKPQPDLAVVRRGFLQGGNHPDDIDGLIRTFQWFHGVPFMAEAIATWTEGDRVIEEMRVLVERAHERVKAGTLDAAAVHDMRSHALAINKRLTLLEREFSAQLGEASRQTKWLLLGLNLALALVLCVTGLRFIRQSLRDQAAAGAEVRRRQESLQRLLDSAAEGLYGIDTEGNCTFVNRSALAMLGYERESDLVGRDIHGSIYHAHADGRPRGRRDGRMYKAFSLQHAHAADEVFWRRDGSSFPVEYWSHPVLQDGQIRGAVVTFFDISEQVRTQAALRESEMRLSRLVDTVADGVVTMDAHGNVVLFNRAAELLFRVSASDVVGHSIEQFIPERLRAEHRSMVRKFARGKADAQIIDALQELIGMRADGEEFPMEASLSKLQTDQGLLITVVLRDVSEQRAAREERRAREALEASNRAKTQFLSRMSHELRTPLNAVLGFAQLMRLDRVRALDAEQLARVRHIEHAGTHLLALVNDVLDLSRVESGQMTLSLEPVDVNLVAEEAIAIVSALAVEARVQIRPSFRLEAGPAFIAAGEAQDASRAVDAPESWVLADRVRLRQVLVNLLTNAVKYNREGGHVTLTYARHNGNCQLVIADTGVGMTAEQLDRLYEPFNRLGAERTTIEGTGIGLVLTRHLVELMCGSLRIDSATGRGTVATVTLQSAATPSGVSPAPYVPSQHSALDGSLSVLYAEDNEVNIELVRQVTALRPAVTLRTAPNGALALKLARLEPPDLMLVDMHLGDMTGMDLAHALRREPATAHIRLVALSADALPEQINAALDWGFEGYLTKPINFRELLRVLDGYAPA